MALSSLTSFHDATLRHIDHEAGRLRFHMEDVTTGCKKGPDDWELQNGILVFLDPGRILRNGVPIGRLHMRGQDGEILKLEFAGANAICVIQWFDYPTRRSLTDVYAIRCRDLIWEATR